MLTAALTRSCNSFHRIKEHFGVTLCDKDQALCRVASSTETEKKATSALSGRETKYVRTYVGMGILVGRIIPELVNADEAEKEMADLAYVESAKK